MHDGTARLINTVIHDNIATVCSHMELGNVSHHQIYIVCGTRQDDDDSSALYAEGGRLRLENGTRFAANSFRVGLAVVIYVLPAPPGHHTNARKCKVVYAPCPAASCSFGCSQDKSLTPAATGSGCTQPPYNIQSCPWNTNITASAFGAEILGAFPLTLTLTLILTRTRTLKR